MNEAETQREGQRQEQREVEVVTPHRGEEAAADSPAASHSTIDVTATDVSFVSVAQLADDDMAHATAAELLTQNREIMGWIAELESSLADCQADFAAHLQQFAQQENLLESRTAELTAAQAQITTLVRDLEAAQKSSQRQRILAETMTAQLETSQERIAQMERECTLSQRRCADQTQQLLQAESLCRDLKSRLNRQQRNTLQFKAALEKSLEVSAVSSTSFDLPDLEVEPIDHLDDFFPRSKPVKPWSQTLDEADFVDLALANGQNDDAEVVAENVEPVFDPQVADNLEAELKSGTDSSMSGTLNQTLPVSASPRVAFVPPIVPTVPIPNPVGFVAAALESVSSEPLLVEVSVGSPASSVTPEPLSEPNFDLVSQANWPAPLVNPLRPSKKKIASLAAIDLPNFPKAQV
ncbi:MAG: hypothetical protein HC771_18395 [Synechococcales cyanobacterium CRU_2_2]|nr:hypothetical protein [Synechococcales cyanobacterium CRU_2_2]